MSIRIFIILIFDNILDGLIWCFKSYLLLFNYMTSKNVHFRSIIKLLFLIAYGSVYPNDVPWPQMCGSPGEGKEERH